MTDDSTADAYVPAYDRRQWLPDDEYRQKQRNSVAQVLQTVEPYLHRPLDQLRVIDIGSGYGATACELAKSCGHVVGIELSPQRVDSARRLAEESQRSNVEFRCQGVLELADREAYDLAILDNVLEHLPDQPGALAAICRALRPDGLLYILVPNKLWPIEVHYRLPFLSYLPRRCANWYLRLSGRGTDYRDASYAPTYLRLRRLLRDRPELSYEFALPARIELAAGGNRWHYRWGVRAIRACPSLWAISKAFLVVARKRSHCIVDATS
jgi:SAM-dependent methyltransferase